MTDAITVIVTKFSKLLVKQILEHPETYSWSLQGLGMLRLYLSKEVRLHVWDQRYTVPNVSELHDHPWHFQSYVIAGIVRQVRYELIPGVSPNFWMQKIHCGPGGGLNGDREAVHLQAGSMETYCEGRMYEQRANEIHRSIPALGSVTIIEREFTEDSEHARVFWDVGTDWVSAIPRAATPDEVITITKSALHLWF